MMSSPRAKFRYQQIGDMVRYSTGINADETGARNHETLMTLVETAKLHKTDALQLMIGLAGGMNLDGIKRILFATLSPRSDLNAPRQAGSRPTLYDRTQQGSAAG